MPVDRWVLIYSRGDGFEVTVDTSSEDRARGAFYERIAELQDIPRAYVRLTCGGRTVDEWESLAISVAPIAGMLPPLGAGARSGLIHLAEHHLELCKDPAYRFGDHHLNVLQGLLWIRMMALATSGAEGERQP